MGYTAVVLDDGGCGLAGTMADPSDWRCTVLPEAGELVGWPAVQAAEMALAKNPVAASVGVATVNAALNRAGEAGPDVLDVLPIDGARVGMVGMFEPYVDRLRRRAAELHVFERRPVAPGVLPESEAERILPECDVVILTSLTLVAVCCPLVLQAGEPVNPNLSPAAREVFKYLESVCQKKVLAGYNVYVHTPDDYEQTGKQAAIWGRDIRWLGDPKEVAQHAKRHRYILTLHWHWHFGEDSAWTGKRKTPVDVRRVVTPGTPEYRQAIAEMDAAADKLQVFEDAGIPVLWRPLHEIDGGWFWWTDRKKPENTAALWRLMYDHFTRTRKLDNLIWVYSAGVGKRDADYRKRFYPGAAYVDISGIDIYGVDFKTADPKYWDYYKIMSRVSPGKMLACGECDAIPNPDLMQKGALPKWLYALPWWGAPSHRRPADWARMTMRHDFIVTLDRLPAFGQGNIAPHVGILSPLDDGSAWFADKPATIRAYAVDRDGKVDRVEFYAGEKLLDADKTAPYEFTWNNASPGCYEVSAVAIDDTGAKTRSNAVRVTVPRSEIPQLDDDVEQERGDQTIAGDVTQTTIDSLGLKVDQPFGYWFDYGDDWWHQIDVVAIEDKVPKGKYPRVTRRVAKSPPQYMEEEK